jgi:thiamine-monophosphate kinase
MGGAVERLSNIGERGFITRSLEILSSLWISSSLPPFDDASAYYLGGSWMILKIDGFSAHSSRYPWNSWGDLGWKAATSCASDIIAKGGYPYFYMLSIGAPGGFSAGDALDIIRGFREAVEEYGGLFAGGDTNSSKEDIWVDVSCIGFSGTDPIPRGAHPGDLVIITGLFGLSGLARIYYEGISRGSIGIGEIPESVVRATSRPRARIEAVEVMRRYRRCIRGSTDVSDSLAESLYLISEASGYEIELEKTPLDPEAVGTMERIKADPIDIVFNGGEEYELVIVASRECSEEIVREMTRRGVKAEIYGEVRDRKGVGVIYNGKRIPRAGYKHFISV